MDGQLCVKYKRSCVRRIAMTGKYKDLSGNVLLFSISAFGHKILAFLLIPLYTNYLSIEQYGTIDLIGNTVNLLIPIFTLNISEAVMRFTIDDRQNDAYLLVGIRTIVKGTCVLACLLLCVYHLPILDAYRSCLGWIFILYLVNSLYALGQNYLRATDRIPVMVIASLIDSAVMLVLDVVLIARAGMGIDGYYIAMVFGLLGALIFMDAKAKLHGHIAIKSVSCKKREDAGIKKACFAYCIPTIFTTLAWWVNSGIDRYFVTGMCGVGQNGIYSIAYKIPTILGIFQGIFNQAWMISAIMEFDHEDPDGFFGKTYELYTAMMVLVTSGILLFNILLSKLLYANAFFEAWRYVPVLLISSLFSALAGYLGSVFAAVKDMKTCAYTVVISAVINIILDGVLIPVYGVQGAAIATALSYIASWGIRIVVVRRYIKMELHFVKDLLAYVLLSFQMIAALSRTHMYGGQVLLMLCLLGLYLDRYKRAFTQLIKGVKKK